MFFERLKNFSESLLSKFGNSKLDNVVVPLAIMMLGTGINFVMFVLIARILTPDQFSQFAFVFTLLSLCAAVGVFGQGDLIFKTWNHCVQEGEYGLARGAFLFGLIVSLSGSFLAGFVGAGIQLYYGASNLTALSYFLFAFFFTLIYFISPATRVISGFIAGDGNMEITWRLFTIAALILAILIGFDLSESSIFFAMSAGLGLAILLNFAAILRAAPNEISRTKAQMDISDWRNRSFRMWLSDIIANLSLHIDILVIGFFIDPALAGGYFVAMRLANIFKRLTAAFANYASRRIAPLHFSGEKEKLRSSMNDLSMIALILVAVGLLVLLIGAKGLLAIFGQQYVSEYWTLIVLAVGASITTLAGPAPNILLHTGHETRYLILLSVGLSLRCLLLIILTPIYGTLGAAIAFAIVSIVLTLLLNAACRKTIGIDPSIFALRLRIRAKVN